MITRFLQCERGNYAAIFSLAMLPLMAGVAGALDLTMFSRKVDRLQNALDSAGLAMGVRYFDGMSDTELEAIGREFYAQNMARVQFDADKFEYVDVDSLSFDAEAARDGGDYFIRVTGQIDQEGILAGTAWPGIRTSVVRVMRGGPACVLALDPHASSAVKIQGSTVLDLQGCIIASNSDASDSIYRGGSARVAAECINTVGTTSGIASSSYADLTCGSPWERQYASFDPLDDVQPPAYTGCQKVPGGKTKTLSPGTYCDQTFSGEVTLEPGTYILRGGKISLGGNGVLKGANVTIFLMEDAELSINANQTIDLTPPDEGPYAGIAIFQDRGNDASLTINGTSASRVSGFVYAPAAHVFYAGTADATALPTCLRLVGRTLEMNGNSTIKSDCTAELGDRAMYASRLITLVQ